MIEYSPGDRYAFLAKSGASKTTTIIVVAGYLVPFRSKDWESEFVSTKGDKKDLRTLSEWGYVPRGQGDTGRVLTEIIAPPALQGDYSPEGMRRRREYVYWKCQEIADRALNSGGGKLLIFDEYDHACASSQSCGPALDDLHKRGRGLDVGMMGGVQEPAYIPRKLFAQANHMFVGRLDHTPDVETVRKMNARYAPGWPKETDETCPDRFGFWTRWKEGFGADGRWYYWRHVRAWRDAQRG